MSHRVDGGLGGLHDRRHVALALVAAANQVAVTLVHILMPELAAWSGGGGARLDGATADMAASTKECSGSSNYLCSQAVQVRMQTILDNLVFPSTLTHP